MARKDFILDDDGDLKIVNGDFVFGYSDDQHIEDILKSAPGDWKEHPLVGASIGDLLNGELTEGDRNRIKLQLQADGYKMNSIKVDNGNIILDVE